MKLSARMMEALCTTGRSGTQPMFGYKRTLDALIRRGLACETTTSGGRSRDRVWITDEGLRVSAERRKTSVNA